MSGLEELLANATRVPWKCWEDEFGWHVEGAREDVTPALSHDQETDARLIALAPDLARIALDMGEALRASTDRERRIEFAEMDIDALLARLDGLAAGKETGA